MANERVAIRAALVASASWTSLVSATNTQWRETWGRNGLEAATAPADANGILAPCAVLTMGTRTPANITHFGEKTFFRLWVYHATDFNAVQAALSAARRILDNTYITADNFGTPRLQWVDVIDEFIDDELGGVVGASARWVMLAGWH